MAYILSNSHIMKFYSNFTSLSSKVASNTTLFDGFPLPCANCTLMGSATFMVSFKSQHHTWAYKWMCGSWIQKTRNHINSYFKLKQDQVRPYLNHTCFYNKPTLIQILPYFRTIFGIMSSVIVVETFYFGDVLWLLSNQTIATLLWFLLPLPFMAPFESLYGLRTTPNIPFWLLGNLIPTHPTK